MTEQRACPMCGGKNLSPCTTTDDFEYACMDCGYEHMLESSGYQDVKDVLSEYISDKDSVTECLHKIKNTLKVRVTY